MPKRDVVSREYKVMLRPNKFAGDEKGVLKSAHGFWQDFARAISGVAEAEGDLARIKTRRLIRFYDTPKKLLNTGRYIFRERCCIDTEEREVTLKFRHADRHVASSSFRETSDWWWWETSPPTRSSSRAIKLKQRPDVRAECALIVWYGDTGARNRPVVAEFSFKYGNPKEDYDGRASQRAYDVFDTLQSKLGAWVDPKARTKTAFVCE